MATLNFISLVNLLSLVSVAPRYLKASTSSDSYYSRILFCAGVVLDLFFITLLFSLLTFIM